MFARFRIRFAASGVCLWVALLLSLSAEAEPPVIATLGVLDGDGVHKRVSAALYDALPETQRREEPLSLEERRCQDPACLQDLGKRLGVDVLMGGVLHINPRRGPRRYTLDLFLFDVQHSRPNDKTLTRGSESQLIDALPDAVLDLLRATAQPRTMPQPESISLTNSRQATEGPGKRGWRTALMGSLGTLGILGLTAAIVAHALHGQKTTGVCDDSPAYPEPHNKTCIFQTVPVLAAGYAVAASSLLGLGLAVFLP